VAELGLADTNGILREPWIKSAWTSAGLGWERLRVFGTHAHVVVSEPLNDLPGAFIEVHESTVTVLNESEYNHRPFLADDR
jgi:hypothetical protein